MNRQRKYAARSPLTQTMVRVSIVDLVAHYELRHEFSNGGDEPIEAVFSFPVPLDAAFMGMRAVIAGRSLTAEVQPAARAARAYDDAIADGDSAVLLEQAERGLLAVSLGNLNPGETGVITLEFADEVKVADRRARFGLPFAYRPRYGRSTLSEPLEPTHNFATEHPLRLEVAVSGLLQTARVSSPTHPVAFGSDAAGHRIEVAEAFLDRDFVLVFDLPEALAPSGRLVPHEDGFIAFVSAVPPAGAAASMPVDLCLVMDCSGSMQGDAIEQARSALGAVLQDLREEDRIQLLRFGSQVIPMLRRPLRASPAVRSTLGELATRLQADLGGTEMGEALEAAIRSLEPLDREGRATAIILVTDGAVQPAELTRATELAAERGLRVFVVAVGSSAGAEVLEVVASSTGGVLERAVPAEPIEDCVMRHLRRARQPAALTVDVSWPGTPREEVSVPYVYAGDAVTCMARLPAVAAGSAAIHFPALQWSTELVLEPTGPNAALTAIFGQRLYAASSARDREAVALEYGLLTAETSAVLVLERSADEKGDGLPRIAAVPHMTPHGMVMDSVAARNLGPSRQMSYRVAQPDLRASYLDIPAFLRRGLDAVEEPALESAPPHLPAIPAEEVSLLLDVLFDALATLIFVKKRPASIDDVLDQLTPEQRTSAARILEALGFDDHGARSSGSALLCLLAESQGRELTDEEEVTIALVLASSKQSAVVDASRIRQLQTLCVGGLRAGATA